MWHKYVRLPCLETHQKEGSPDWAKGSLTPKNGVKKMKKKMFLQKSLKIRFWPISKPKKYFRYKNFYEENLVYFSKKNIFF